MSAQATGTSSAASLCVPAAASANRPRQQHQPNQHQETDKRDCLQCCCLYHRHARAAARAVTAPSHLIGGDAHVLKDEGAVEEKQVVGVWRECRAQSRVQGCVGSDRECASRASAYVKLRMQDRCSTNTNGAQHGRCRCSRAYRRASKLRR